jgi:hypothetical protein
MLREDDLHLPRTGWGRIAPFGLGVRAGRAWADEGAARQERGLKHRADNETRGGPVAGEVAGQMPAHGGLQPSLMT